MPSPEDLAPLAPAMTAWRRDIHAHPELGFEETRTAALVAKELRGRSCVRRWPPNGARWTT